MSGGAARPRLVLATRNPGKVREIAAIYDHLGIVWLSLADVPEIGEVAEEGATYAANAAAKARAVAAAAGLPALADDSGVEIDALGGAPGIHSARFLAERATDAERNARILHALDEVPAPRRTARYVAAVALALPDGSVRTFEGTCEGAILPTPRGSHGFGYDPIFLVPEFGKSMAQLPPATKNRISHRAQALTKAKPYLRQLFRASRGLPGD